jgi:hypothetical protein
MTADRLKSGFLRMLQIGRPAKESDETNKSREEQENGRLVEGGFQRIGRRRLSGLGQAFMQNEKVLDQRGAQEEESLHDGDNSDYSARKKLETQSVVLGPEIPITDLVQHFGKSEAQASEAEQKEPMKSNGTGGVTGEKIKCQKGEG